MSGVPLIEMVFYLIVVLFVINVFSSSFPVLSILIPYFRRNIASNLDFVNKYDKVFLAFDNDEGETNIISFLNLDTNK